DDREQEQFAETVLLLLRLLQTLARFLKRLGGLPHFLLHLLVGGDGLDRALTVAGRPRVGLFRRFVGVLKVFAQIFVLDQALHVRVLARRPVQVAGAIRRVTGLALGHPSPSSVSRFRPGYTRVSQRDTASWPFGRPQSGPTPSSSTPL